MEGNGDFESRNRVPVLGSSHEASLVSLTMSLSIFGDEDVVSERGKVWF